MMGPDFVFFAFAPAIFAALSLLHPDHLSLHGFAPLLALNILMVVTAWGLLNLAGAEVALFLLRRNIPFVVCYLGFWSFGLLLGYVMHVLLLDEQMSFDRRSFELFMLRQSGTMFMFFVQLAFFQKGLARAMGRVPGLVPIWQPVSADSLLGLNAALIQPDLGGRLRSLRAQNQYVLVNTTSESRMVRMTLQDAIRRLPAGAGLRVHRSWWLSFDEMSHCLSCKSGQQLRAPDQTCYPVSRSNRDAVADVLTDPTAFAPHLVT